MKNKEIKNNLVLLGLDKIDFIKNDIEMVALFNINRILPNEVCNEINAYKINKTNENIIFMTKYQFSNIFLDSW